MRHPKLPFALQEAIEDGILDSATDVPSFAQVALTLKPEALERLDRRRIVRIDVGLEPMEIEIVDRDGKLVDHVIR